MGTAVTFLVCTRAVALFTFTMVIGNERVRVTSRVELQRAWLVLVMVFYFDFNIMYTLYRIIFFENYCLIAFRMYKERENKLFVSKQL